MKIQTNLAPRQHAFAPDQFLDLLFSFVVVKSSVVRMCADCCVNRFVLLAHRDGALERSAVRVAGADVENY